MSRTMDSAKDIASQRQAQERHQKNRARASISGAKGRIWAAARRESRQSRLVEPGDFLLLHRLKPVASRDRVAPGISARSIVRAMRGPNFIVRSGRWIRRKLGFGPRAINQR